MFEKFLRAHAAWFLLCLVGCGAGDDGQGEGPIISAEEPAPSTAQLAAASGGELSLRTRREMSVPGKPEWMAQADLDGDGREEVLAATNSPGAVLLWRQADGELEIVEVGDFPLRPVALRGKNSSRDDVAIASRATRQVTLFDLSEPNSAQALWTHELADLPMVMTGGELDLSRGAELFVVTRTGQLERADHAGSWSSQDLNGSLPRCALVLGPELGLVVGFQGSDSLEVYVAVKAGELRWRARYSLPGTARDLLALDVDSDGNLELIVVEGDQGGWILGLGAADPFAPNLEALPFKTTAIPIRLLPLSQDSESSWVLLAAKGVAAEFWGWNKGSAQRSLFSYAGQTPMDFVLSDCDGDGRDDLWVANPDAHRISLLRLGPKGPIQPLKVSVGAFPNDIATGDLDGDSLREAFVINAKDTNIALLARDAGGRLATRKLLPSGPSPRAVVCADLNLDGEQDLLWLTREPRGTRLQTRLGDGTLELANSSRVAPLEMGIGCRDLVIENFPGDERAIVVATDHDGGKLLWTRAVTSNAQLIFETPSELELPGLPRSIATVNFKGSARAIVVAVQLAVDRSRVQLYTPQFAGDQSLTWQLQGELDLDGCVLDIATGDIDGDGIDDLAYLASDREGSIQGRVQPLLIKGGQFRPIGLFPTGLLPQRILARDFNGDGRAELFVANLDSHNVNAWMSVQGEQGQPTFKRLDDVGAGVGCIALDAMDFDGDGDEDLLVVDSANDGLSLILNETR